MKFPAGLVSSVRRIISERGINSSPEIVALEVEKAFQRGRSELAIEIGQKMVRGFKGDYNLTAQIPTSYPGPAASPYPLYGYDRPIWYATPNSPRRRPDSLLDEDTVRRFADTYDIVRSCINHLKREVQAQKFSIVSRDTKDDSKSTKRDIENAYHFFTKKGGLGEINEGRRHYEQKIFEDVLVIGCFASWRDRTKGGDLIKILPIDGVTIRPRMDAFGWPGPGEDWYEQWILGMLITYFRTDELDYDGLWPVTNSPWFRSPIEYLIGPILTALKSDEWNRAWLTDGNVPGQTMALPADWTVAALMDYMEYFNGMLQANAASRQKTIGVPGGTKMMEHSRKDQDFKEMDLWLARRAAAVYGVQLASIGFAGEQYKVSQEGSMDSTSQFGAGALLDLRKEHYDDILEDLGFGNLEVLNGETAEESSKDRTARLLAATGGVGWMSPSQAAQEDGGEAIPDANEIMVLGTYVPLSQAMAPPQVIVDDPLPPESQGVPSANPQPDTNAAATPKAKDSKGAKSRSREDELSDLSRWERKALNRVKRLSPAYCLFESTAISPTKQSRIKDELSRCRTLDDIRDLFRAESEPDEDDTDEKAAKKKHLVVLLLNIVDEAPSKLSPLAERLIGEQASIRQFSNAAVENLKGLHIRAATIGRIRATGVGSPAVATESDVRIGSAVAESQRQYLEKMASQILSGDVSDAQLDNRMRMYGQRAVGTANESWKQSLPPETLIDWVDTGDSHECEECPVLAAGGPYTPSNLPTVPGACATPCLTQCRCYLETQDGDRSFYDPLDEMP